MLYYVTKWCSVSDFILTLQLILLSSAFNTALRKERRDPSFLPRRLSRGFACSVLDISNLPSVVADTRVHVLNVQFVTLSRYEFSISRVFCIRNWYYTCTTMQYQWHIRYPCKCRRKLCKRFEQQLLKLHIAIKHNNCIIEQQVRHNCSLKHREHGTWC